MMNDKDCFEILGINGREDSYTNLLKYAFDNNIEFRKKFCMLFAKQVGNYKLFVRYTQATIYLNKKCKDIPDMLLVSEDQNEVILIENKLFSGEGWEQTTRYSDIQFLQHVKSNLNMDDAIFNKFYYLTLDGQKAKSPNFISMKWSDVIIFCCEDVDFSVDPRIAILMNDLLEKSKQYNEFAKPIDGTKFFDYLYNDVSFISTEKAYEQFFEEFRDEIKIQYGMEPEHSSANNMTGKQLLIVCYRNNWHTMPIEKVGVDKCRNIHIELNWVIDSFRLSLNIHYETEPYLTQSEIRTLDSEKVRIYNEKRALFKRKIYNKLPLDWHKVGRSLSIINVVFVCFI